MVVEPVCCLFGFFDMAPIIGPCSRTSYSHRQFCRRRTAGYNRKKSGDWVMSDENRHRHGTWSSRWTFILAATGSAVGLGNIWKFPYIAGENGGGAFVLVYLCCILLVGVPVMMAEVMLGRKGGMSPINTMRNLSREAGVSRAWVGIGWVGAVVGILIVSYYAV